MQRSAMYQTLKMCECGNISQSETSLRTKEIIESYSYPNCDNFKFNSDKSLMSYREYLILY